MIRFFPLTGVPKTIVGPYGPRTVGGVTKLHDAVDLGGPMGTPVVAVDDGMVSWGSDPTGGNVAVLRTADGLGYYMAHLEDTQSGKRPVKAGEQIGRVGMSGNAANTIPHTHFQVWPGGQFGPPGTVHPDPTADLMAADVLPAPTGDVMPATGSSLGLAIAGGLAIIGVAGLAAWAIHERRHPWPAFARENPTSSQVQSLMFSRDRFSPSAARAWARSHGFRASKTDVTSKYIHIRQHSPGKYSRIRTISFGHGVQARVGW